MPLDRRGLLRSAAGSAALAGLAGPSGLGARRRGTPPRGVGARAPGSTRLSGLTPLASGDPRTEPVEVATPFSMVAVAAPPGAEVGVRVSADGEHFGSWLAVQPLDVEREGPDGEEARRAGNRWQRMSTPVWTSAATWLQLHVDGAGADEVEVIAIDSRPMASDAAVTRPASARAQPAVWRADRDEPDVTLPVSNGLRIVTREEWEADESWRGEPSYAERVLHGVVHHTVNSNSYTADEAPQIVRGIYHYHARELGWNDIGYNLLVDRFGVVYEGRFGGLDLPVIGAHARGANTGSFGVALIGDFTWDQVPWPQPREAIFELLLWKFGLHAIDPDAVVTAAGREGVATLSGHRDVGSTQCPGDHLHGLLPEWRDGLRRHLDTDLSDIAGHPHEANIRSLRAAGVTTGYPDGTYRPQQPVTRAQMATFLTRAAKLEPAGDPPFRDVTDAHPHAEGIASVAAAQISEGWGDGTFRPELDVTRAQMATFLARAVGLEPRSGQTFNDVPEHHPHHGRIEAVAAEEIALGRDDGSFRPDEAVTRGQMASFLVRAFDLPPAGEGPRDPDDLDEEPPDDVDDDEHQVNGSSA